MICSSGLSIRVLNENAKTIFSAFKYFYKAPFIKNHETVFLSHAHKCTFTKEKMEKMTCWKKVLRSVTDRLSGGAVKIVTKTPILEGWSEDKKYCITNEEGERFLLRVTDIAQFDKKQAEFNNMQRVAALGIPMCVPIEFGTCAEGVYAIHSWIEGKSAESVVPKLPPSKQYDYGIEAGQILRKIHSIPAPESQEDWEIILTPIGIC